MALNVPTRHPDRWLHHTRGERVSPTGSPASLHKREENDDRLDCAGGTQPGRTPAVAAGEGRQVVAETGQSSGQMEVPDIEGQPSFVMWWTDEDRTDRGDHRSE